jgi:hypothetical protein
MLRIRSHYRRADPPGQPFRGQRDRWPMCDSGEPNKNVEHRHGWSAGFGWRGFSLPEQEPRTNGTMALAKLIWKRTPSAHRAPPSHTLRPYARFSRFSPPSARAAQLSTHVQLHQAVRPRSRSTCSASRGRTTPRRGRNLQIIGVEAQERQGMQPCAATAAILACISGLLRNCTRTCSRVSAPVANEFTQKLKPERSPPRRRNA